MKVLETIQRSSEYLGKKGVESPRLNAELLLSHVLGMPRMKLYLDFERELTTEQTERVRELVVRRGKREPLQQITGSACFCGLEFLVNRDVLTPRPETELLAELGWKALEKMHPAVPRALDFGTGSGCLAVTLAVKSPAARVTALDVSPAALDIARHNANQNGVAERISFLQSEGFSSLGADERFDLMIANPPYIRSDEIATLQPEVRDYEPRIALDGGQSGLDFYISLAGEAGHFLTKGASLMMEFGDGQAARITEIFLSQKWIVEPATHDYTGRPRILVARKSE